MLVLAGQTPPPKKRSVWSSPGELLWATIILYIHLQLVFYLFIYFFFFIVVLHDFQLIQFTICISQL